MSSDNIQYQPSSSTSGTFTFIDEDHTLGNALRTGLLRNKQVVFSGYRIPHPLEKKMTLTIKTNEQTTPHDVLNETITMISNECDEMERSFLNSLNNYKENTQ